MPAKLRIYLDTSVVSAYLDTRDPGRQELTLQFWRELPAYDPHICPIVIDEVSATHDPVLRDRMLDLIAPLAVLSAVSGITFMYALSLDTATRVTAVVRVNLIFAFVLSYAMLGEKSDWQWKVFGTVLIIAGTVAVAF